jgi:hypothetical protein
MDDVTTSPQQSQALSQPVAFMFFRVPWSELRKLWRSVWHDRFHSGFFVRCGIVAAPFLPLRIYMQVD